ncbi:MAG: hypothetical protein J0L86_07355 [Flavobacteriales bacterium]|nr:hypothetical protein [Flavobacteriales bacterium]
MFTIYSDKDIFENIISNPNNYPNWNKIIKDHSNICLNINQVDLDAEKADPETYIFLFLQANARNIDVIPLENYFQTIYNDFEIIIENPTSAYFLNIPEIDAKNLQDQTGLIINCKENIDDDILIKGVNLDWLADDLINNNWTEILSSFNNFPSNSLIINDRNLFSNEERVQGLNKNIGIDNLLRILDNLIPQNLKIDYHILVQSEQNSNINNKQKCDQIATILNNEIRNLRPYNFIIEIVFFNRGTMYFPSTHNRKIVSNYKIGKVEYSFAAFKIKENNTLKYDDSFNLKSFFENINSSQNCSSNLKAHENATLKYTEIASHCIQKINQGGPNDNVYRYYLNGIEVIQGQITKITNRLLN